MQSKLIEVNANEMFQHPANKAFCMEHCRAASKENHMFFMDGEIQEHYDMSECTIEFIEAYKDAARTGVDFVLFHNDI